MIQPEPEGSTQGYPLVSVEVLRHDTKRVKVDPHGFEGYSNKKQANDKAIFIPSLFDNFFNAGHLKMEVKKLKERYFYNVEARRLRWRGHQILGEVQTSLEIFKSHDKSNLPDQKQCLEENASKIDESSTCNMKGWTKMKKHGVEFDPKKRNSALRREIAKDRTKARAYIPPLHFFEDNSREDSFYSDEDDLDELAALGAGLEATDVYKRARCSMHR
uniref:Uncharacterized protein n=1 Tax=Tanacetum cinerariifolium TaxID=118510 RepID=A0A6L2K6M8_TANCI|nr:hypothetical protein [Tanacetum cinerariifolium]